MCIESAIMFHGASLRPRGLGGTPQHARWGVVANGSNGEMCSLCTIELNPIVARDSMLFSLLFDDKVAVKPGIREKNLGLKEVASKSAAGLWICAQDALHSAGRRIPVKRSLLFFSCTAPNPSSRGSGSTAQINKTCSDTPDCSQTICPPAEISTRISEIDRVSH